MPSPCANRPLEDWKWSLEVVGGVGEEVARLFADMGVGEEDASFSFSVCAKSWNDRVVIRGVRLHWLGQYAARHR